MRVQHAKETSAPRGFAATSHVLSWLASLAIIGELARKQLSTYLDTTAGLRASSPFRRARQARAAIRTGQQCDLSIDSQNYELIIEINTHGATVRSF